MKYTGGAYVALLWLAIAMAGPAVSAAQREQQHLWRDPGNVAARDLYWGMGRPDAAPRPPFTFVKEDLGGSNPKVRVTDARGTLWSVKFPGASQNEVHAEIAAARLMWAVGYLVEENYFVASGRIEGVGPLSRAAAWIDGGGTFHHARFEKRPRDWEKLDETWTLDDNPFAGTRELDGLKLMTALLHNWDTKFGNVSVVRVRQADGATARYYLVTDLGATFGRMARGLLGKRSKWNLDHYRSQDFLEGVDAKTVRLNVRSRYPFDMDIPIEHARWFGALVHQLTPAQVRKAFAASGAEPQEVAGFSEAFLAKVAQLVRATASPADAQAGRRDP